MSPIGPDDAGLHPGQIGSASPLLFTGLVDDAAMFPPGNASLETALREHRSHRSAWYAGVVGPLLVPASRVDDLMNTTVTPGFSADWPEPLAIGVIAPGGLDDARTALARIAPNDASAHPAVEAVAVELPLASVDDLARAWSELGDGSRPVWWEIDREGYLRDQLGRLAGAARSAGPGGAKLRTGGPDPAAVPTERQLGAFLRHAIDLDLTFKLTAGLHHAVRCTDPTSGVEQHGVLNLLCAVKAALNGAEVDELADLLAERESDPLVRRTHAMSEADASVMRAFWSSFGCCGVTDPIDELVDLGLLAPTTAAR
jgi:hypothetical protein